MKFPHVLIADISPLIAQRFRSQHGEVFVHEGLWRRTQDERNAPKSGRRSDLDQRRKIIYVKETYSIIDRANGSQDLALMSVFLWVLILCPDSEGYEYRQLLREGRLQGGWREINKRCFARGDLRLHQRSFLTHPHDELRGRKVPTGYSYFEFVLGSHQFALTSVEEEQVWNVVDCGIRRPDTRGTPRIVTDIREILEFFPMQLEIGCGPSTEIGVPPLHVLHQAYGLSEIRTGRFLITPEHDCLFNGITRDPEGFFRFASRICVSSVSVPLGVFYPLVKQMYDIGHIVGPVITHNFDGILRHIDVPFDKVRRYTEVYMEDYPFDPRAKSLLVVGVHADRRKIQAAARKAGLQVIYVDPEGFSKEDGFVPYLLESPQCSDILMKTTAANFAAQMKVHLKIR